MKIISIIEIQCDKVYRALSCLDTYPIFDGFDHECKIAWRDFYNLVENIEKVKGETLESLALKHNCTIDGINLNGTTHAHALILKRRCEDFFKDKDRLDFLCQTFKEIENNHINSSIEKIIFKQENN